MAESVTEDQWDITEDLEKTIKTTCTRLRDAIEITAEVITSGNFDNLDGIDDSKEFILNAFDDEEMLVVDDQDHGS